MKRMGARRMGARAGATLAAVGATLVAITGCNTLLDNNPASGLLAEEAGTEPSPTPTGTGNPVTPPMSGTDAGMDSAVDAATPTPGACPGGQHMCNGICVGLTDPLYGCGDPSCMPCARDHATATCQGQKCAVGACDRGYADCDGNPDNGCEGDLSKATSCGTCNAVCPAATPNCAPVGEGFQCITGCTPAAPLLCGNECVDPNKTVDHCGGCNVACPNVPNGTSACQAGQCTFTCKAGFNACNGKCTQKTDPAACGPACTVCPVPVNGRATCAANACGTACNVGFADCDANPANGCEAELAKDPLHCGACGKSCNGQPCENGVCKAPPPPDAGADAAADAAPPPPPP